MKRGVLLSEQRMKKGLSVSALAQKLGVSEAEAERWETGELPDSEHLLALSELLDISVEDILRAAAEGSADGAEDGAGDEAEAQSGAKTDENPHRFDFGELRQERKNEKPIGSSAPDGIRSDSAYVRVLAGEGEESRNGYFKGERRFGYVVFALFTAVIAVMLAVQFAGWLSRPRELTMDNYRDYLEIDVAPTENFNPDDYVVRVTAKEDIAGLRITVRVAFWNFFEDKFFEMVIVTAAELREDETTETAFHISEMAFDQGFEVLSAEGDLA